jgi:hydroxymethylpyrimidine pyrophosphatase-like HAD family hydrolase
MGTKAGAVDLESKFTEAAIGVIQLADFRNFAHGRHHWLAKRGKQAAVIAFITQEDGRLAEETLSCLPPDVPVVRFAFDGDYEATSLGSLLASVYLTGWAGEAKKIDPGRPGVPKFGENLYNFPGEKLASASNWRQQSYEDVVIARKTGRKPKDLKSTGSWGFWFSALSKFTEKLKSATFSAVIMDYDGTLVDTRDRFSPPTKEISEELSRILSLGITIGIATGRGPSVRKDLRKIIPEKYWSEVLIGYYNCAEVGNLDTEIIPNNSVGVCKNLEPIYLALQKHQELQLIANINPRQFQITIEPKDLVPENRLWDITNQLVCAANSSVVVVRSSHSVDILSDGVSKAKVLDCVREKIGSNGSILTIGDRGRWPGNDFTLLQEPYSLSVDEVSTAPETCWNLAPVGQRGVRGTLHYLRSLLIDNNGNGVFLDMRGE